MSLENISSKAGTEASKCGFVALIGAPNAGKSTLTNALVSAKVAIVTHKVQTTRTRVTGIGLLDLTQLVFIDTPGIFAPKRRLDRAMVKAAWQGSEDAETTVLVVDARKGLTDDVSHIIEGLKDSRRKAILVMNKIDEMKRDTLLALAQQLFDEEAFSANFMISGL